MLDALVHPIDQQAGAAFNTADLMLLRGWSEFHGLTMQMDLAGNMPGVPYDEAILLTGRNDAREWLLWRDQDSVALTRPGRIATSHTSVSDALLAAIPPAADPLTDIQPTGW